MDPQAEQAAENRRKIAKGKRMREIMTDPVVHENVVGYYQKAFAYLLTAREAAPGDILNAVMRMQTMYELHSSFLQHVIEAREIVQALRLDKAVDDIESRYEGDGGEIDDIDLALSNTMDL